MRINVKSIWVTLLSLVVMMSSAVATAQGQDRFKISGTVMERETKEPIPYAAVVIEDLNLWCTTDGEGSFTLQGIIPGTYNMVASSLGYKSETYSVKITKDVLQFNVYISEETLSLSEVVVTATTGTSLNSSSKVDRQAIDHLQTSSISDIMQLVPGAITVNSDLSDVNNVTIRSITSNTTDAYGVGFMINGSKVSSDASMLSSDGSTGMVTPSIDFRNYSTNNIESVEVLKGVVSAEYGDISSGQVIVTTKAGQSPYEVRFKTTPNSQEFSLSKGFRISDKGGNINFDIDHAKAFSERISPVDIFDRNTFALTYSNTFNRDYSPFKFNIRLSGYQSGNSETSDPDVSSLNYSIADESNVALSIYGDWMLNRSWITSLKYNLSGNYTKKSIEEYSVTSSSKVATTNSTEEGESVGYYVSAYNEFDFRVEDVPIYLNAKISGSLNKNIGGTLIKTLLGVELSSKGNIGIGEWYIGSMPQYYRPVDYSDTPFVTDLSAFLEETIKIPTWGRGHINLNLGVRANQMIAEGYDYAPTLDPRFNVKVDLISPKRSGIMRELKLRAGWGIMHRMPSISQLYPTDDYVDFISFNAASSGVSLITTYIRDRQVDQIEPSSTYSMETGFDFNIAGADGSITYYNEKTDNAITRNYVYEYITYNKYANYTGDLTPEYKDGAMWVGEEKLESYKRGEYLDYDYYSNTGVNRKWGIEYDVNLGKIEPISTSIIFNGAYINQTSTSNGDVQNRPVVNDIVGNKDEGGNTVTYPYIAVYEKSASSLSFGSARDRLNTNVNFVTNIPAISMVVSMTLQCVWMDRSWNIYPEGLIYSEDENGNAIYGDYNNKDNGTLTLYRDPLYYIDSDGVVHPFSDYHTTTDATLKQDLAALRISSNVNYYFMKYSYAPYFMGNIRVTKEIGDLAAISLYVNNFTNSNPVLTTSARPNALGTVKNSSIFFGAELKLTF
ncbi:MAG: TonB-dependent receptor [Rikenellaceae bacterium]